MSGTGIGEEFYRRCACHAVAAHMAYGGASLAQAVHSLVFEDMKPGDGGVVAVDRGYNICMAFNSVGMYRGCADSCGRFEVAVFPD